jgi:hypothetical protein
MANLQNNSFYHILFLTFIRSVRRNATFPRRIGGGTAFASQHSRNRDLAVTVKSAPTTVRRVENVHGAKPRSVEEQDDEH